MRKNGLIISVLAFLMLGAYFISSQLFSDNLVQYSPRQQQEMANDTYAAKPALEYLHAIRANQHTGVVDLNDVIRAMNQVQAMAMHKSNRSTSRFFEMGPNNIGGRTRAILIDRNNPNIVYCGGVAGGLWKSTTGGTSWTKLEYGGDASFPSLTIVCITQAPNGHIYFGTGEGHANANGTANGSTGFIGGGIWKSVDGNNFTQLSATMPSAANSESTAWAYVNQIATSPTNSNLIYAATNRGLRMSQDGGINWTNPVLYPTTQPYTAFSSDVDVASDGTVIAAIGGNCFRSLNGIDGWERVGAGTLPSPTSISRIEFAIAPSDPNYMYASAANNMGHLENIYRSIDRGMTWEVIGPGGSVHFAVFSHVSNNQLSGGQGWYDNVIAVYPNNKNRILVGGIDMWQWDINTGWANKSFWSYSPNHPRYIHADHHTYQFHPTNPNIIYVGSDGGVSRSLDGGNTWQTMNRGLNITQFYTLGIAPNGRVMGGTQDNGTLYNTLVGNDTMNFIPVMGGDGASCDFSIIDPKAMFASVYYGNIRRSPDEGGAFSENASGVSGTATITFNAFLGPTIGNLANPKAAAFIAPSKIWESFNNPNSTDYITWVNRNDGPVYGGETMTVFSRNGNYPIEVIVENTIEPGDTAYFKDIVASKFYMGFSNEIWFTKDALDFSVVPTWHKIATIVGTPQTMDISGDGDMLLVGTTNGRVYRITNLLTLENADDALNVHNNHAKQIFAGSQTVTSLAIDQLNENRAVVTLGNYGNSNYVYLSTNVMSDTPTFTAKQGNLPPMPVYASLMVKHHENKVYVGTEYGLFHTSNISASAPVWEVVTDGIPNVPIYHLRQQTKLVYDSPMYGAIYAATHGRGIFCDRETYYTSVQEIAPQKEVVKPELKIYPNPLRDEANVSFKANKREDVLVTVFDMSGKVVFQHTIKNIQPGIHKQNVNFSNLPKGTYFLNIRSASMSESTKFIIQ